LIGKLIDAALEQKVLLPEQMQSLARILASKKKRFAPTGAY
jgi:hypothetical protein